VVGQVLFSAGLFIIAPVQTAYRAEIQAAVMRKIPKPSPDCCQWMAAHEVSGGTLIAPPEKSVVKQKKFTGWFIKTASSLQKRSSADPYGSKEDDK
jgi:hypothetical protein